MHLGSDGDVGKGQYGRDTLYGGGGTSGCSACSTDQLYGNAHNDELYDRTGPDYTDVVCGHGGDDLLDSFDGDNLDDLRGGDGADSVVKDQNDSWQQGGTC